MSQEEYDNILYRNLVLKLDGFKNRLDYEEVVFRKVAYSSIIGPRVANARKMIKIDELWPLSSQKKKDNVSLSEKRQAIKDYLKIQNQQNG